MPSGRQQAEQDLVHYRYSLGIKAGDAKGHNELGCILARQGKMIEAEAALERAVKLQPDYGEAYRNLGNVRAARGSIHSAMDAFRKAIRLLPGDPYVNHMLAALNGDKPPAPPSGHVDKLFDQYADIFERHVKGKLGYCVPTRMRDVLEKTYSPGGTFADGVDLGCGTGLSGETFAGIIDCLHGIDLSWKMLDKARQKKVYETLARGDICEVLQSWSGFFDIFIAADVFVYIGDLEELFLTISCRARHAATFLFSTERETKKDYRLRRSGRYAHRPGYIFKLAEAHGFHVSTCEPAQIRKEHGRWLSGDIYLLRMTN